MTKSDTLNRLIKLALDEQSSDLHLSEGRVPILRSYGVLDPISKESVLTREDIEIFLDIFLSSEGLAVLKEKRDIDFSFAVEDLDVRFRGNVFFRQGKISIALRLIPSEIKTFDELGLPESLKEFTKLNQGFFLVVGPIGNGKSTTLAAMIEMINEERSEHIVTIEDPMEYVFKPKKSIIDQREVRSDAEDFPSALRAMFRQDVDVLMVGEMRETETISTAVTAAETGHLVFSTLHTNTASQTIDRIIDSFPADQQEQIRAQLSSSLTGIFSIRLVPKVSGGLVPAYELLINNTAIANLIRERRIHEIDTVIETSSESGMISLDKSLANLVQRGEITVENALANSLNRHSLEKML